jgi:hypothetical protein
MAKMIDWCGNDGDLRRMLEKGGSIDDVKAKDVMAKNPFLP